VGGVGMIELRRQLGLEEELVDDARVGALLGLQDLDGGFAPERALARAEDAAQGVEGRVDLEVAEETAEDGGG